MSYKFGIVMVLLTLAIKTFANFNNTSRAVISSKSLETGVRKMCSASEKLLEKKLAPPLSEDRHKGQAGRIGIFGGSIEYTGRFKNCKHIYFCKSCEMPKCTSISFCSVSLFFALLYSRLLIISYTSSSLIIVS